MRRFSAKQKKELYSLSSLLFHLLVFIILLISLGTDPDNKKEANGRNPQLSKETETALERFFASAHP